MEDSHVVAMLDPAVFPDAGLFAVLDGHGGWEVSALASKLLAREVNACGKELRAKGEEPCLLEALQGALPRLDAKSGPARSAWAGCSPPSSTLSPPPGPRHVRQLWISRPGM